MKIFITQKHVENEVWAIEKKNTEKMGVAKYDHEVWAIEKKTLKEWE